MGFKGTLGWRLKTKKVSLPLMRSLYDLLANKLIETAKNSEEFNQGLRDYGKSAAGQLLMDYSERIAAHASTFPEFSKTLALAYKVNTGQDLTRAEFNEEENAIYLEDTHCIMCDGVELDSKDFRYCDFLSGVFEAVLDLRGFTGTVREVTCKAIGDEKCTWVMKQTE